MTTHNPAPPVTGVRVVTDVNGQITENVWIPMCDQCGALVLGIDAHRTACPRIVPPKPEPIPVDRHEWARIIHAHRATPITYTADAPVICGCKKFTGAPFAHSQHVAAMLANHVEANR